jgi:hypothetical protein
MKMKSQIIKTFFQQFAELIGQYNRNTLKPQNIYLQMG